MAKHKKGDQFQWLMDDWTVIAFHEDCDGVVYWVVNRDGETNEYSEESLNLMRKVVPFFEVGKTYQFSNDASRYKVTGIREVNGEKFAWAEESAFGRTLMITLDEYHFRNMTEV